MAGPKVEFPEGEIVELLRRHGHEPKKRSGHKYTYYCVFHADGHEPNMSVDGQKNTFYCFACPENGGILKLAEHLDGEVRTTDGRTIKPGRRSGNKLGRPPAEDLWKEWADALWTEDGRDALAILHGRGLKDETLRRFNVGVTFKLNFNEAGGDTWRITIPVFDENGNLLLVRRYHPKAKYRSHIKSIYAVDDPSLVSEATAADDRDFGAPCPKCERVLSIRPQVAETEISCPGCSMKLYVVARSMKMSSAAGKKPTIFGQQLLAELRRQASVEPDKEHRIVIVGGEWDRLMLVQNGIDAVTGTGGESGWKSEWTRLFDGLNVVIMLDADKAGQTAASKLSKVFQERSRCASLKVVQIPFRPDDYLEGGGKPKDATDWFKIGRSVDELLAAIDVAEPYALNFKRDPMGGHVGGVAGGVGAAGSGGGGGGAGDGGGGAGANDDNARRGMHNEVDDIRDLGKEVKTFRKCKMICDVVLAHLGARGRFMRTREKDHYYFDTGERRLHVVCDDEFKHFLGDHYGLNPVEKEFNYVVAYLEKESARRGELVKVRRFVHWVKQTNTIYLSQFDGNVVRVGEKTIDVVPNGTDGVVFLDPDDCEPWTLPVPTEEQPTAMTTDQAIAEIMRYVTDIHFDDARCPPEIAQKLLFLWITSVFFGAGIRTRPICTFLGERGSGKTMAFRRMLQLCFGHDAEVLGVRADNQDDMHAAVMSNFLVVFDNVDSDAEFLNDELAKIATGMKIVRRRLYSTLGPQQFKPDCFVGITTQTPNFTRSDVIDRMLLFRVSRRADFGVEPEISTADRNRFFQAMTVIIQSVLTSVREGKRPAKSPYRLADWSTMAFLIGISVGWPVDEMEALMSATEWLRTDLQADEDPLVDLIARWMAESDMREGKTYRAAELVTEWNTILEKERAKIRYHSKWVGRKIKDAIPALSKRWKVTITRDSHEHIDLYTFERLRQDESEQGDLMAFMETAKRSATMGGSAGGADGSTRADGQTGASGSEGAVEGTSTTTSDAEDSFASPDDDDGNGNAPF